MPTLLEVMDTYTDRLHTIHTDMEQFEAILEAWSIIKCRYAKNEFVQPDSIHSKLAELRLRENNAERILIHLEQQQEL